MKRALFYQPQFRQYKKEIGTQPTPIPLCYILVVYKLNTTFKIITSTIHNLMYKTNKEYTKLVLFKLYNLIN